MSISDNDSREEMSLKELLFLLWEHKWLLLLTTVAGTAIALAYALKTTPIYQVDALVQVESKDAMKSANNPLGQLADLFEATNPTETEIELLKSRMVLGQVVADRKLDIAVTSSDHGLLKKILRKPKPKLVVDRFEVPTQLLDKTFVLELEPSGKYALWLKREGEMIGRGRIGQPFPNNVWKVGLFVSQACSTRAGNRFLLTRLDPLVAVENLRKALTVAEIGKKTGMIQLTIEHPDPDEAVKVLDDIASTYVRQNVERKSEDAQKTLEFLNEQLPDLKKNLEESEQRLNEYRSRMGSIDLDAQAQEALEQQVEVQQKLVDLEQKRKEAAKLFRPDHPNVRTLDSIGTLYKTQAEQQDRELHSLPMRQQEVVRLMRDAQVNTQLYTNLLNSAQQLRVVKAGEIGNVRIVDPALPSNIPVKPKKPMIVLVGLIAGFALGAGIALLRRQLQNGITDPKVLEKELGLPVYATIPHSSVQERLYRLVRGKVKGNHLLSVVEPSDLAVESFKSLRTTLHFSMLDAPNHILLFAGPNPSIGKSFVSTNFAATLAQAGHKVVLVDADLRRGLLHQHFGLERGLGLSDILSGAHALEDVLVESGVANLLLLSTGTLPPNASELLLHERFGQILAQLDREFDYVVIDSAPVLAVTDAVIVGRLAGTSLMVLKHGKHPLDEIDACAQRMNQAGVKLKGVVFNDIAASGAVYGYRYGRAAYRYEYKRRPEGA